MYKCLDEQLVASYFKGDDESLEILIKCYLKPIYGFVYKYIGNIQETEDITQEVFVKVWRHLKRFNRQKRFKTWIFSIAKNTCIDWMRKKKTVSLDNLFVETIANQASSVENIFEKSNIMHSLESAVEKLMPKYRLVLSLRYNNDLSFREIAERLGEPLNTVKSRYRRAIDALKKNFS